MSTLVYCTLEDLQSAVTRRRLVEATNEDDPSATGEIVTSKVDAAIAAAGDLIDGYVGKRYPLPLPMVPDVLRRIAVDLTVFNLYSRVRDLEIPDSLRDRRKEALRMLELISQDRISLGLSITAAAPEPIAPIINHDSTRNGAEFSDRRLDRMDYSTRGAAGRFESQGAWP